VGEPFARLPAGIVAEVAAGCLVTLVGGYGLAGALKPALLQSAKRSVDAGGLRLDLAAFNNRGRALPLGPRPAAGGKR